MAKQVVLSLVVPVYNEGAGLLLFHDSLIKSLKAQQDYEIIYIDDGSADDTASVVKDLARSDESVRLLKLSRHFGKENALTAGINQATGQAIITIDGDGQHPVRLVDEFIDKWRQGARVVVGVRLPGGVPMIKRLSSRAFYTVFNHGTGQKLVPGSTDFRLIDKEVKLAFQSLPERDRITRGLIDWLGFERDYVYFEAGPRMKGKPGYSLRQLLQLAANSFVSLSPKPLYIFGYLGLLITAAAFLLGVAVIVEQLLLGDPWAWDFTGSAMLAIMILFLVGLILLSQGILSMYVSHIHSQSKGRPLYVIDKSGSIGIT